MRTVKGLSLKFSIALVCLASLLVGGCSTTPKLTPGLVTVAVATGVTFGTEKYPQAVPYVRLAGPVICAAAASTNVQPQQVVAALESAGVINPTNTEATLIVNGSIAIYDTIFQSYGANWVSSQPALQGYLQAVCDGITEGLPASDTLPPAAFAARSQRKLMPHLP